MGTDPVCQSPAPDGRGKCEIAGTHDSNEHRCIMYLTRCGIGDGNAPAVEIVEDFIPGTVFLSHGQVKGPVPALVPVAELVVLVAGRRLNFILLVVNGA